MAAAPAYQVAHQSGCEWRRLRAPLRAMLAAVLSAAAGAAAAAARPAYTGFKVAIYARAQEVQHMKDTQWLASRFDFMQKYLHVDKVYIETHRDHLLVDGDTIEKAKAFFAARGVQTAGGITWTISEPNRFQTFCYSDPKDRAWVSHVAEETARHFDEIILDDFFFTSCKSDGEIAARGDRSWTAYRLARMREAARDLVIGPARRVNPRVRIIIKFPNWYEHFQGMGFDLEQEPYLFDGVYTGTETRDPVRSAQHLQAYNGYSLFRYLDNLRPGHNGGGWVDPPGSSSLDRYAEQLWVTLFAKAPQITLFDFRQLQGALTPNLRGPWQGQGLHPSFDYDAMMAAYQADAGAGVQAPPTFAVAAGFALRRVDKVVTALGRPLGVAVYRPFHSTGEDFLPSFLGMIGIPVDIVPRFPAGAATVLLTEDAAHDPEIVAKIERQVRAGGNVVITSGLLERLAPRGLGRIAELQYTGRTALVKDFEGRPYAPVESIGEPMLIPQIEYITNDTWELSSAIAGDNGFPLLTDSPYGRGHLYVLVIPDNFADLYRLPASVLDQVRAIVAGALPVRMSGPSKVSLYEYDNGTFVLESFRDEPVTVGVQTPGGVTALTDLDTGAVYSPRPAVRGPGGGATRFIIRIPPHSFVGLALQPKP
ncbi:MAG TPA: hypothetical protein VMB48_02730 [Steroidobacteraceae bacterium]|nr:hypothetical protein [Steroidobacteraceae bacterium]